MLSAACNVCSQRQPGRKTSRKGKPRFGRDTPGVDIVLPECAELIDQLPVIVEARLKRSARLMIEQSRADAVTDLAPTALLIVRACRIEAEVVEVGLPAAIDDRERHGSVGSPKRLLRSGTVVEGSGILLGRLDAEQFKSKRLCFGYDSGAIEAR